ncbi:MAG: lipoate--protein ligase family protein [Pseudomonadota bacterium]
MDVPDAKDGLAREMAMLNAVVDTGTASAFLWQASARALVLPERYTREAQFERAAHASAARGWPVFARKTGGGITPQGPGVLNLALCFTVPPGQSRAILSSYAKIVDPMRAAFAKLGLEAEATPVQGSFCDGDYNLAIAGRKIVGTAQRWRGSTCLIHALLMTDIDLEGSVAAVARFSQELGHDTAFQRDVHCRLADLMPPGSDTTGLAVDALWEAVSAAGFAAYAP